jgi:hypothetical protein
MGVGVSYKIVDYSNLNMTGKPFEEAIMHMNKGSFEGLPNQEAPYCSGRLKTIPCQKLSNDMFGNGNYLTAIGFRKEDMPKRITWAEVKANQSRIFPLLTDFTYPQGLHELSSFWKNQTFKLGILSQFGNCELCWKKSKNNVIESIRYGTRFIEWWQRMEEKYGNTSFRGRMSINDYVQLASQEFTLEIDFTEQESSCVCSM